MQKFYCCVNVSVPFLLVVIIDYFFCFDMQFVIEKYICKLLHLKCILQCSLPFSPHLPRHPSHNKNVNHAKNKTHLLETVSHKNEPNPNHYLRSNNSKNAIKVILSIHIEPQLNEYNTENIYRKMLRCTLSVYFHHYVFQNHKQRIFFSE